MCQNRKIVQRQSAGDCSISLKFRTDFDHLTLDVPRPVKVNVSKSTICYFLFVSVHHSKLDEHTWAEGNVTKVPSLAGIRCVTPESSVITIRIAAVVTGGFSTPIRIV